MEYTTRKFKFRAWNLSTKHMYNNVQDGVLCENDKGQIIVGCTFGRLCADKGSVIMQSTDRRINNVEIFEYDVLKNKYGSYFLVYYSEKYSSWILTNSSDNEVSEWYYLMDEIKDCELCGNIFENPELLDLVIEGEE